MHRNVLILALTQIFAGTAPPVVTMVAGIIGTRLAPNPSLATLPAALMAVGLGFNSIPAALIMGKIGRKAGFLIAFAVATIAIFVLAYAVSINSFLLLCISLIFVGGNMSFVSQFRFAAAESVQPEKVSKAISLVLVGGIVAAYLGPEIGKRAIHLVQSAPYVGSFLSLGGLYLVGIVILSFYKNVEAPKETINAEARPIGVILKQPGVIVAIAAGAVAFAVMVTIMVATPIQMHVKDGHSMGFVALIIQGHLLGMYVPSLFTGQLVSRFGVTKMMMAGIVCLITSISFNISGHEIQNFAVGLVFLGVGWNFLFISGTTLLTENYTYAERFKTQAANDFIVYTTFATGSLFSGAMLHFLGWEKLNLIMLVLVAAMIVVLAVYVTKYKNAEPAKSASQTAG
jgi:MFS family permease